MATVVLAPHKSVLRVWHHHRVFEAPAYHAAARRGAFPQVGNWHAQVPATIVAGELLATPAYVAAPEFRAQLLLLHHEAQLAENAACQAPLYRSALFSLGRRAADGDLWLQLNATDPAFFGYPRRAGFGVAPLRIGRPVRVLLNARWWHGISRRHATRYFEWDFVYEYCGEFGRYTPIEQPLAATCDPAAATLIDLRKRLF